MPTCPRPSTTSINSRVVESSPRLPQGNHGVVSLAQVLDRPHEPVDGNVSTTSDLASRPADQHLRTTSYFNRGNLTTAEIPS